MAVANAINATSSGLVSMDSSGNFSGLNPTDHNVVVGTGGNTLTSVPPSATAGIALVSAGALLDPTFSTTVVAGGGTGQTTFANTSALLATGTTSTGAFQNIASVATGQILISGGLSTLPSWSATLPSAVQGNITAVGTIASGTWQGSVVGPTYGGTGVNNGSNTLTLAGNLATSGAFATTFTMTGATGVTFPTSGTLATTSQIPSLPLSTTNGGTGISNPTAHDILIGNGSSAMTQLAPSATSGVPLISQGSTSDPAYGTAVVAGGGTGVSTFANTSALLATGTTSTGSLQNIASVATGQVLTSAGTSTLPAWSATLPSTVQGNITTVGTVSSGTWNGTAVDVAHGGTGKASFTNHSGLVAAGTTDTGILQNIASVAAGQVLTSAGTSTLPAWSASPSLTSIVFPSAGGSGSSSSDTLSVYEEGSFTPVLTNASTPPTLTYATNGQVGKYVKIGSCVFITIRIILTAYTAGTGNVTITGLPFAASSSTNQSHSLACRLQNITAGTSVLWYTAQTSTGGTDLVLAGTRSAASALNLVAGGPTATTDITITGFYLTF